MPAPFTEWKVLPHGKLVAIGDTILTVEGTVKMPLGEIPRRMTIVRLADGRLIIWSAIALDELQMREIESFGRPAFLVVPNAFHRLDARIWKDRYPNLVVIAPAGSRERVEKVVAVDMTQPDFDDAHVTFVTVPGTREHEAALEIEGIDGTTLVLNDVVNNVRAAGGFSSWLLQLLGFAGDEAQVPITVKMVLVKEKEALADQFRRWADLPLKRILVSHGEAIADRPSEVLREIANSL